MKLRSNFYFGFLLGVALMLIPLAFMWADLERGYDATGGELFMVALPILIIQWRRWSLKQLWLEKR